VALMGDYPWLAHGVPTPATTAGRPFRPGHGGVSGGVATRGQSARVPTRSAARTGGGSGARPAELDELEPVAMVATVARGDAAQ